MSKVRQRASFAKLTPIPRTKTEPPNAHRVRKADPPWQAVHRAPIVWPGNLKKRERLAKTFVPLVYRASTRTHQTCRHASSAQLVTPNLPRNKRRAFHAAPVNSMVMLVWLHVNLARKIRITAAKEETAVASIVPRDGCPPVVATNAKRVVRGRSVMVAKIAHWDLQEKEVTLTRRNADNVTWGKQRRLKVRPRAVAVI